MADKEQVIQALRATLISVKGALTIKQCNRKFWIYFYYLYITFYKPFGIYE